MNEVTILGIAASLCTATAAVPQLYKVIKCKKAGDISNAMLLVLIVGLALWVYYGFAKSDVIIIVANIIPFVVNTLILILSIKYRHNDG